MFSRGRLTLLLHLLLALPVAACSVPVFRYALEHWQADPFQLVVIHRGALPSELESSLAELESDGAARANLAVHRVDLDEPSADESEWGRLFAQQPGATTPWMIARFPASTGIRLPVYSGPLTGEAVRSLTDSPARREVVKRLSAGQSAVWLLLESGDQEADDKAAALLQERLKHLASVMTLPKLDEADIANGLVSVREEDLKLEFSIHRVSRSDAAEQHLVTMLLRSEDGLEEIEGEPMVFPVFGRGRSLYALVGAGIRNEMIEAAAAFLIGKCSCQVKEQNPGVDLLMVADWDAAAKGAAATEAAPSTPLAESTEPETVTTHQAPSVSQSTLSWRGTLYIAAAAVLLALALVALQKPRRG